MKKPITLFLPVIVFGFMAFSFNTSDSGDLKFPRAMLNILLITI